MIGDVIGRPGREAIDRELPGLRDVYGVDFVTANGENLAGGMGLTTSTAESLFRAGVDVLTSGNHIWDKKEILPALDRDERILRPHNYGTDGVPGRGWGAYVATDGTDIAVLNFQGRTYMIPIENPFTDADRLLDEGADHAHAGQVLLHAARNIAEHRLDLLEAGVNHAAEQYDGQADGRRGHDGEHRQAPIDARHDGDGQ